VERQADHDGTNAIFAKRGEQRLGVRRELFARDHRARMRKGERSIRYRKADRLFSEVERGERHARCKQGRQFLDRYDGHSGLSFDEQGFYLRAGAKARRRS